MEPSRHFAVAPWPRSLKVSSSIGTVLLVGIGVASFRAIPVPGGFTYYFGLGITLVILRITWQSWATVRGHEHTH